MGSSQTTVQKADPWAPAQPYILEGLDAAQNMWNSNPNQFEIQPWDGPAVAGESSELARSRNLIGAVEPRQRALLDQAQSNVYRTGAAATNNQNAGQFNTALNSMMYAQTPSAYNAVANRETGAGPSYQVNSAVNQNLNTGLDAHFDWQTKNASGISGDARKQYGNAAHRLQSGPNFGGMLGQGTDTSTPMALQRGVSQAQNTGLDSVFDQQTRGDAGADPSVANAVNIGMQQDVSQGLTQGANRALNAVEDPRLSQAVSAQNWGNTGTFDNAIRQAGQNYNTNAFGSATNRAMNAQEDPRLSQAISQQSANNTGAFNRAISDGQTMYRSQALNQGVNQAMGMREDPRLSQAINAQSGGPAYENDIQRVGKYDLVYIKSRHMQAIQSKNIKEKQKASNELVEQVRVITINQENDALTIDVSSVSNVEFFVTLMKYIDDEFLQREAKITK